MQQSLERADITEQLESEVWAGPGTVTETQPGRGLTKGLINSQKESEHVTPNSEGQMGKKNRGANPVNKLITSANSTESRESWDGTKYGFLSQTISSA